MTTSWEAVALVTDAATAPKNTFVLGGSRVEVVPVIVTVVPARRWRGKGRNLRGYSA